MLAGFMITGPVVSGRTAVKNANVVCDSIDPSLQKIKDQVDKIPTACTSKQVDKRSSQHPGPIRQPQTNSSSSRSYLGFLQPAEASIARLANNSTLNGIGGTSHPSPLFFPKALIPPTTSRSASAALGRNSQHTSESGNLSIV
jgi:hypothetical protein